MPPNMLHKNIHLKVQAGYGMYSKKPQCKIEEWAPLSADEDGHQSNQTYKWEEQMVCRQEKDAYAKAKTILK